MLGEGFSHAASAAFPAGGRRAVFPGGRGSLFPRRTFVFCGVAGGAGAAFRSGSSAGRGAGFCGVPGARRGWWPAGRC